MRRALLLAPLAVTAQRMPAVNAQPPLVLQGTAARRYLGFRVYEAQLYLPRRVPTAAEAADPCEIRVHYLRAVSLDDVRRAWVASLNPLDPGFDGWLRPIAVGDEERYRFTPAGALLEGPGRPPLQLPPGGASASLRAAWLGPQAPAALLRGWFPQG